MRFSVSAICLVLLHVNLVYSFGSDNVVRVKRSNETEGFTLQKISDGVKSFGSRLSNVATKGYEEMKNLFSSKRKVGDYTLNNIDVRVRDEEDYEEVSVKRPKRDAKLEDTDEISVDFVVNLDDLMKDMKVLETTKSILSVLDMLKQKLLNNLFRIRAKNNNSKEQRRATSWSSTSAFNNYCTTDMST